MFRRTMMVGIICALLVAASDAPVEFVPPAGAKSASRIGGTAVRCSSDPNLYVSVLAPADSVGLTSLEHPTIYWYLSKPTKDPVEIAITDVRNKSKPVLSLTLPGVDKPGVQKLDLAKHDGAKLTAGGSYECVIEIVTSADAGSRNASAVCRIARIDAKSAPAILSGASKSEQAALFAKQGLWFDYIAALLDAVHADAKDKSLLTRLGGSLKKEKLIWKEDGNIDELATAE